MTNPMAKIKKLAKFLAYVMGRQPDEFGLLPDADGYIDIKTLLKALHEEEGWRHIRRAHLNEIMTTLAPAPFEIDDQRIRCVDRSKALVYREPESLPKLLYLAIRRRAYASAIQRGVRVSGPTPLIMSADRDMARRLGQRIDNDPVILTIQVAKSISGGVRYQQYGELLYVTDVVLPDTFSGPAPPKERPQPARQEKKEQPATAKTPGSYFPETSPFHDPFKKQEGKKRRKEADWKKARRQARRHKSRQQR